MKRIPISKPDITDSEKAAVMEVLESGFLAQGPRTALFEEQFAQLCGVRHAIAVSNGTCALVAALLANDIGPGDEVITTPFTFMATANAILFTGAKPVFVDIDGETFNVDPQLIEAAITPRTKAILPVHLYGQMCEMEEIRAVADRHGLKLIEDACQSVGASYKGKMAGSFGTGTFSFYATKNLMTGEGGMVTTNDDVIAEKCRMIRSHGMKQRYYHEMVGYNFRMMDLQAAIGLAQLERLETMTARRRFNAGFLNRHIEAVSIPKVREGCGHVWHQYTVRVNGGRKRDDVVRHMNEAGIDVGVYYPVPVHKQKSIQAVIGDVTMPVAEKMAGEVLSLPVHPLLSEEELAMIVAEINKL
ncbi:MAG: DegT/DnrJ/EryC1/StrS family aminotransferase [Chloroflexi bacterium]|nr:DegT/DnrJ/EryC1/StrS family aminotransferase [Chloroflexota bacterium]